MKKSSGFIKIFTTCIFAGLVLFSPFLANAVQLLEQPVQETIGIDTYDNADKEVPGDYQASIIDQSVVVNAQGNGFILLLATKHIDFIGYFPVILTNFQKYVSTAFTPSLLCFIKNILLFFSAPHAP
jgi:hypothetical protein